MLLGYVVGEVRELTESAEAGCVVDPYIPRAVVANGNDSAEQLGTCAAS